MDECLVLSMFSFSLLWVFYCVVQVVFCWLLTFAGVVGSHVNHAILSLPPSLEIKCDHDVI